MGEHGLDACRAQERQESWQSGTFTLEAAVPVIRPGSSRQRQSGCGGHLNALQQPGVMRGQEASTGTGLL